MPRTGTHNLDDMAPINAVSSEHVDMAFQVLPRDDMDHVGCETIRITANRYADLIDACNCCLVLHCTKNVFYSKNILR